MATIIRDERRCKTIKQHASLLYGTKGRQSVSLCPPKWTIGMEYKHIRLSPSALGFTTASQRLPLRDRERVWVVFTVIASHVFLEDRSYCAAVWQSI